jgi:hypothetical protein
LARPEEAPDDPAALRGLADVLDREADADPEFRSELESLVEEARRTGADVDSTVETAGEREKDPLTEGPGAL